MRLVGWLLILLTLWSTLVWANPSVWEEPGHDHVYVTALQPDDHLGDADHSGFCNHLCHASSHLLGLTISEPTTSTASHAAIAYRGDAFVCATEQPPFHPPKI